jgi:tRNA1Val (adenine37-N6)-methyltransferase
LSVFKFKQFQIQQFVNSQKITTDTCVFGSLFKQFYPYNPERVLDVGAGTGVLSLMAAQYYPSSKIYGLEIDCDSCLELKQNYSLSSWANRLETINEDFRSFESKYKFDLIFSNPPFFSNSLLSDKLSKTRVRHQDFSLSASELLLGVSKLLDPEGVFICIYPFDFLEEFLKMAANFKLYPQILYSFQHTSSHPKHRFAISLSHNIRENYETRELVFKIEQNHYSPFLKELLGPFYLEKAFKE